MIEVLSAKTGKRRWKGGYTRIGIYIYIYITGYMQISTLYEAHMSWLPQSVAVPIRAVEEAECNCR